MEATERHSEGTPGGGPEEGRNQVWSRIKETTKAILIAVWHYLRVLLVAIILLLGVVNAYDILVGDTIPKVGFPSIHSHRIATSYQNHDLVKNFEPERAWQAIQPSLKILDEVCPEASDWLRDQHKCDKLTWMPDPDGTYAYYDFATGRVTINAQMFELSVGERAVTVAHEFRHSRQNIAKFIRAAFCVLLTGKHKPELIETDAYLFEHEVRWAIFGK